MPTVAEIRIEQKRRLIQLKRVEQGKITLAQAIKDLEGEMEQEDVAYVEKTINQG